MKPVNISFHPNLPQQQRFVLSSARYPCYFGGINNGKTLGLVYRALIHSLSYANNSGVLCRKGYRELADTTRAELFRAMGCDESSVYKHPLVSKWNATENLLRFVNGSEIRFRHLQDEKALQKLMSLNIRWFGVDQAEEVPEAAFLTLIGRIGRVSEGAPAWGALVGNPGGHDWIWHKAVKNPPEALANGFHLEQARTTDSPFAPAEYIAQLYANYPQNWVKRFVDGSWDVFVGQVFEEFDSNIHIIRPFAIPDEWKIGLGCDLGWNHPTAFVWAAKSYDGDLFIYDELREHKQLPHWFALQLKSRGIIYRDGSQLPIYAPHDSINTAGPSGTNYQREYQREGINMLVGNRKPRIIGITRLQRLFQPDWATVNPYNGRLGRPRLFIFDTCQMLKSELEIYRWQQLRPGEEGLKEKPDDVVKVDDDLIDALRMIVMSSAIDVELEVQRVKSIIELEIETLHDVNREPEWEEL